MRSFVSAQSRVEDGCCRDAELPAIQLLYHASNEARNTATIACSTIEHMYPVNMHVLLALLLATAVHGQQQQVLDLLSVQQEALQVPLRAVGQLTNGCTGYLIGPCHVCAAATAAST